MAGEYDDRFVELTGLLHTAINKVVTLETKLVTVEKKVDGNTEAIKSVDSKMESLTSEVRILSSQFQDVGAMAIKDNGRIANLEKRVDDLEAVTH